MHSCNIHFFEKISSIWWPAGRLAAFFILLRRKSWEEIDFFHEKNNNNCKARGCIFLSGYEEGSTSKMLLLFTLLQHYYYVFSSVKSWIRNFLGVCSEKIPKAVLIVSAKVEKNTILFNLKLKQFQFSKK